MLQIEVEAQPVPQDATMSHGGKGVKRQQQQEGTGPNKGTVRDRNQRVRPTFRERSTDRNLGAPSQPQYRPSRIRKEKHEREGTGKGAPRRRRTSKGARNVYRKTCCGDLDWPSDSYVLEGEDLWNDEDDENDCGAVHHLQRR